MPELQLPHDWKYTVPRRALLWQLASLFLLLQATMAAADPVYFHKYFAGKIGNQYAFTMDLKNVDGTLSGKYRYTGRRADVYLSGKIDPSGAFKMDEVLPDGKRTGIFTGTLVGKAIDGNWQSADGTKHFPFDARQTSEILIGSKRDLLTQAIGRYTLDYIEGSGGANGMWNTSKDKGKWASYESGIVNMQREVTSIALKPSDIRPLDSISITVDPALATRFSVGDKILLTMPYRDNGMQYDIRQEHKSTVQDQLKSLSPGTTVHDEQLYLLARDGVDYSATLSGNFRAIVGDIVIVRYSVIEKTFTVSFQDGRCCDSTDFTFRRTQR